MTADNSISGNNIGVGANGETPLGNEATGIAIFDAAPSNLVNSNLISSNGGYGSASPIPARSIT